MEIFNDPDPDTPAAILWFKAPSLNAAIAHAHRFLATHPGPDDQFGELYQRDGDLAMFIDSIHLGA